MIEFTSPDGTSVWIMKAWVQIVRHPLKLEYPPTVNAVIKMSGFDQAVQEDVALAANTIWNADA